MARGRIPKPKEINSLKGDTHKRRRHTVEPEAPKDRPECPEHLGEIATDQWHHVTEQLDKMGLLSVADRTALEMYCSAYERYRLAEEKIKQFGEVIISPKTKYPMVSPYVSVLNKNLDTCRRYQLEFGMTPAGRSRLAVPKDSSPTGNLMTFVNGK